jgi:hypothetical protein
MGKPKSVLEGAANGSDLEFRADDLFVCQRDRNAREASTTSGKLPRTNNNRSRHNRHSRTRRSL